MGGEGAGGGGVGGGGRLDINNEMKTSYAQETREDW